MNEPMSEERLAEFRRIERDAYQRVDHRGWFPVVYASQCLDEIDRLRAENGLLLNAVIAMGHSPDYEDETEGCKICEAVYEVRGPAFGQNSEAQSD